MQKIKTILKISGGESSIADEYGDRADAPMLKVGIPYEMELDLRLAETGEDDCKLQPYPYSELSSCTSFVLCMDGDWDHDTTPPIFSSSGITLTQSADGKTLLSVIIPNTARTGILSLLQKNKQVNTVCAVSGTAPDGDVFDFDFNVTLRNRLYLAGDTPPEEITNDPEYLTATQIQALIADLSRSTTPGPQGNPGAPGEDGDDGKSAYELAIENGYSGTVSQWLQALKGDPGAPGEDGDDGEDGKGLYFDRSGTVQGKSLYDDEAAGFKYAAAVVDSAAKKTTIYIWTKLSNTSGDWSEPFVAVMFATEEHNPPAVVAPIEFAPPSDGQEYYYFSAGTYPHAYPSAVSVTTASGEEILPYYSELGIKKIIKASGEWRIYFGSQLPAYTAGKIYLSQMVAPSGGTVITPESPSQGNIYYGYVNDGETYQVSAITAAMLTGENATEAEVEAMGKTAIDAPAGAVIFVLIPASSELVAKKDDGLGGKVAFDADNGTVGTGANGASLTLDGVSYRAYGEFNLVNAETFIYIEQE